MIEQIEKDGFFKDPDKIRSFALKQDFWSSDNDPNNANYPGYRSDFINELSEDIFYEFTNGLYDVLGLPYEHSGFFHSFFQYTTAEDGDSWVHRDNLHFDPTHVGLVYLTPNPQPNSGTILYTPKYDGAYNVDNWDNSGDPNDYEIKRVFENKYNRLVVYDPQEFHKSDTYFGNNRFDSRLFIVFFARID